MEGLSPDKRAIQISLVKKQFGQDAFFAYIRGETTYLLTVEEAVDFGNNHMPNVPNDVLINSLTELHETAEMLKDMPDLFNRTLADTQKLLGGRAVSAES